MRNYPSFPRATPHQWAGSPRVPHPSATLSPEGATFDLHALGTPPALILSQDQTLHQIVRRSTRRRDRTLFHVVRASSTMRRIGPAPSPERIPTSASVLHLRPPTRHRFPVAAIRIAPPGKHARRPTCQCAAPQPQAKTQPSHEGRLIYHIPLPASRKDQDLNARSRPKPERFPLSEGRSIYHGPETDVKAI